MKPNRRMTYRLCRCCTHPPGTPVVTYDDLIDPMLRWERGKDGGWSIVGMYEGAVLQSWIDANPRPA